MNKYFLFTGDKLIPSNVPSPLFFCYRNIRNELILQNATVWVLSAQNNQCDSRILSAFWFEIILCEEWGHGLGAGLEVED